MYNPTRLHEAIIYYKRLIDSMFSCHATSPHHAELESVKRGIEGGGGQFLDLVKARYMPGFMHTPRQKGAE